MNDDAKSTTWPPAVEMVGRHAIVTPLTQAHAPALAEAVRDGDLWKLWYTSVPSPGSMGADVAARLARREKGTWLPFGSSRKPADSRLG